MNARKQNDSTRPSKKDNILLNFGKMRAKTILCWISYPD